MANCRETVALGLIVVAQLFMWYSLVLLLAPLEQQKGTFVRPNRMQIKGCLFTLLMAFVIFGQRKFSLGK